MEGKKRKTHLHIHEHSAFDIYNSGYNSIGVFRDREDI